MPKWWTSILIVALAYIVIVLWLLTFFAPSLFWVLTCIIISVVISVYIFKLIYDSYKEQYETGAELGPA